MSLLGRLFGKDEAQAKPRTRICVECGMPVAEHKDWCSVFRGQNAIKLRTPDPQS
jgi:hypothetical protein